MAKMEVKCSYCGTKYIEDDEYYGYYTSAVYKCPFCGDTNPEYKKKLSIDYKNIFGYDKKEDSK